MRAGVRFLRFISSATFVILSVSARATEVYPRDASVRIFGTDQGNVTDCQSEAEIDALETAFASADMPLRFSLFYRHAYNWRTLPDDYLASNGDLHLQLTSGDRGLLNSLGGFVPEILWPEGALGYDPHRAGVRPHPTDVIDLPAHYRAITEFGYSEKNLTILPKDGATGRGNYEDFKSAVLNRKPVVLGMHGDIFQAYFRGRWNWNPNTGLLEDHYSTDLANKALAAGQDNKNFRTKRNDPPPAFTDRAGLDHALAVVGFDDTLYADQHYEVPGAFIIRNSWISQDEVKSVALWQPQTAADKAALQSMRLKISGFNLPEYFALPAQYVYELFKYQADTGYRVFEINFKDAYDYYHALASQFKIVHLPYACGGDPASSDEFGKPSGDTYHRLKDFWGYKVTANDPMKSDAEVKTAQSRMSDMAQKETDYRDTAFQSYIFSYATLSQMAGSSRDIVAEFYSGRYVTYYCPRERALWPTRAIADAPSYRRALDFVTANPFSAQEWMRYLTFTAQIVFGGGQ